MKVREVKKKKKYKYKSCKQCRLELQCVMREKMSSGLKDTKEKKIKEPSEDDLLPF